MRQIKMFALVFGLAAGLLAGFAAQAWAQYPPPTGGLVLGAGDTTPDLGQSVAVTATVVDESGQPLGGVDCTFSIAEQPGSDATVQAGPFETNPDGTVSTVLQTGSAPGTITVEASCGDLSAQVSVVTSSASGQPGAALPPASLPETGQGPQGPSGTNWAVWALVIAGAVIGVSGMTYAWRRTK